jgi:TolB-like protein/DNA-binding CsgD family transcriptional regulator
MHEPPVFGSPPKSLEELGLTGRQFEVLALMMQGKSNKAICRHLDMAEQTVKKHVTAVLKALNASNRTEAVIAAGGLGISSSAGNAKAGPAPEGQAEPRRGVMGESVPLALPEKPSIVVLPFTNLSGDPSQEYFADGMVEDVTLALGRLPWLFVIGSTSAFTYKDQAVDTRIVGNELGVRYVLRGSVRKDNSRVRITAQLTDASHGGQIWADRFEGELDDIFAMQDRVAADVSTMIAPALYTAEIERSARKPTENLTAYDLFLRASRRHRESFEQNQESLRLLYRAIELDPTYAAAYGLAAICHFWQKLFGWIAPDDPRLQEGVRLAHLAAETGKNDSEALWMASQTVGMLAGELELAIALVDKSISLNPNSPSAWTTSGIVRSLARDTDLALDHAARARRHNPLDPLANFYSNTAAFANFWAGRYVEAEKIIDQVLTREPGFPPALRLKLAICGLAGRTAEGREYVKRLLAVNPGASIAAMKAYYDAPLRPHPQGLAAFLNGLRASGLPES